jgi:Na+/proline symporter
MMVQRSLSCKDLPSARKAMIGSGVFVFLQFTIFLFVGTLLNQFFQLVDLTAVNSAEAKFYLDSSLNVLKDRELPLLINSYLPDGVRGILLVGVLSAAMSTLSSSINSLSSSTLRDVLDIKDDVRLSKIISVFWAFALIFIASVFDESNDLLLITGLRIASFTYGTLLSLFLLRLLDIRPKDLDLIVASLCGVLSVFVMQYQGLAWTWFILVSTFITMSVSIILSPIFPSDE